MNQILIHEVDLFPSKLGIVDFSSIINLKDLIADCMLVKSNDSSRTLSNRGGFQSNNIERGKYNSLDNLSDLIVRCGNSFMSSKSDIELVMDNCWLNINPKYSYNTDHIHPDSLISGTFYIQTPDNSGNLVFSRSDNFYNLLWSIAQNSSSPFFSSEQSVTPKPGMLVLFGSWETHSVEQNLSDEERISFSFNLKPKPL